MHVMARVSGTHLGPYEIGEEIGRGGMGEVYRATDTRLGREVAIKILPHALAEDADRLARFEREAKLLASLHHAHIASVFSLDEQEGTLYLAMELVTGETLEEKLKSGPLAVEDALELALQIALALEAAHERGVVHRDLKPANVMITPDGVVKVLDFGLAKAFSGDSDAVSPAHSPALSAAMTQQGVILGTAGYMSPEQASGQATDQRADIWGFAVVLFEMLTGLPLFSGESVPHILADVLRTEPDWNRLPENLHPRIRVLLAHCLRKKPRNRYHSIADVRIEIEDILADPDGVTGPPAEIAQKSGPGRRGWIAAFVTASIVALALIGPAMQQLRQAPPVPPPETRLDIVTPPTSEPLSFALSPDGSRIAFVAFAPDGERRIWLRQLASTTAEVLAGTEQGSQPFWSPDGESIGFFAGSELKRIDLVGGAPQTLATINVNGAGSWGADGVILYSRGPGQALMRVDATGGEVTAATTLALGHARHTRPCFLPDGHRFVFQVTGTSEVTGMYLGSLDNDELTQLTASTGGGVFSPDGSLLWIDNGRLLSQPLDLERSVLADQPVTVATDVAAVSAAAGGIVAYRAAEVRSSELQWRSRSGELLGTIGGPGADIAVPRVSPDGRRVAFSRGGEVWISSGSRSSQITFDGLGSNWPVWSPMGDRIAFGSARTGNLNIYVTQANATGAVEPVFPSENTMLPTSWSPDGRYVLFFLTAGQGGGLGVMPMDGEAEPHVLPIPSGGGVHGVFSPDGRWIAFQSARSGSSEVWLWRFVPPGATAAAAPGLWQVSTAGGIFPAWSANGEELYYLNPDGDMMAVAVDQSGDTPVLGDPERLFASGILGGGVDRAQSRQYDVAQDGRFIINVSLDSELAPITLIQNWHQGANQ